MQCSFDMKQTCIWRGVRHPIPFANRPMTFGRAISAAQGVAKLAVQTVERSQGDGLRFGQDGISGADASHLARRLRMACSTLEVGSAIRSWFDNCCLVTELNKDASRL